MGSEGFRNILNTVQLREIELHHLDSLQYLQGGSVKHKEIFLLESPDFNQHVIQIGLKLV